MRFSDTTTFGGSLAGPISTGGVSIPRAPQGVPVGVPASAGAYSPVNIPAQADMRNVAREIEKEAALEAVTDAIEVGIQTEREGRAEQIAITAPTSRAGYVVALVCGLLLFYFISTYVFAGNKFLIGGLIVCTAIFFILVIRSTLEKKGARYIGSTGGAVLGVL